MTRQEVLENLTVAFDTLRARKVRSALAIPIGIGIGFACAVALRDLTSFPASVKTWVAMLGLVISSTIGLFFGIYPAQKTANLDPVKALRTEAG